MQTGHNSDRRDLEDRPAVAIGPAELRRDIALAVAPFHQASLRITAIVPIKCMERLERAVGGDLKNRAVAENRSSIVIGSPLARRAVKTAVAALNQAGGRATAVGAVEGKQG